ncbi:hypothetical protein CPIN18021_0240 [Campylobacter pinnipediorum subsp. caledonicus]|uniref:Uncharacterized protein n=1 Tax=Campylobacter pinnipediorum subsp. caledonicus TaxID=1874362 RepID=A0A1S6U6L1_9BACT|nr:hypothetical protein CPIN18021_0240 [Campylobacter pinnipediorum subsp. caledonicus]
MLNTTSTKKVGTRDKGEGGDQARDWSKWQSQTRGSCAKTSQVSKDQLKKRKNGFVFFLG